MKRNATGLLILATVVYIVTRLLEPRYHWLGFLRAMAEASMVGGLADWFAVTALFRRPLGLPIPHTGLIPANWQLLATRVGSMVGGRVLTAEYVTREISRVDLASLLAHGALAVRPAEVEPVVAAVARWAAGQLPPESAGELVAWLRRLLAERPVAPLLAELVEVAHDNGWDERLIDALAQTLVTTLDRPDVRQAVGGLIDGVVAGYGRGLRPYPSLVVKVASVLGLIDRDRLVSALSAALRPVAADPADPLRRRLSAAVGELPGRLRGDAALRARVEATKAELLASPGVTAMVDDAATRLQAALIRDLASPRSEVVAWICGQIEQARQTLASDAAVRAQLDRWLKERAAAIVERYQKHAAAFIERGVHALGSEGAVRLIEEHAGDDLQYIRVNGTLVGGLAGGAIYAVHLLLRWL